MATTNNNHSDEAIQSGIAIGDIYRAPEGLKGFVRVTGQSGRAGCVQVRKCLKSGAAPKSSSRFGGRVCTATCIVETDLLTAKVGTRA